MHALVRSLRLVLERSPARVVLAVEAAAGAELERLSQALAHHGARIVLGRGIAKLARFESLPGGA